MAAMAGDPVSWLLIKPGWKVYAADGDEVGEVNEVAGDETHDIFDGLALATSAFGKPRYVLADDVAEIDQGSVRLSLTTRQVQELGEYLEPATSAEIEPENKGGIGEGLAAKARQLEADVIAPIQRRQGETGIVRRFYLLLRRLISR